MREPSIYMSDRFMNQVWTTISSGLANKQSRTNYFSVICSFADHIKKDPLDADIYDARLYIDELVRKNRKGELKEATVNSRYRVLSSIYEQIIEHGYHTALGTNPFKMIDVPQLAEYIDPKQTPNIEQMDKILEDAKADEMTYLIVAIIIRCALTVGEVRSIRLRKIVNDAMGNTGVRITHYKKERYVKLPEDIIQSIDHYLGNREYNSDYLFSLAKGKPISRSAIEKRYRKYVNSRFSLQDIRNGAIAYMLRCGATTSQVCKYIDTNLWWMKRYDMVIDELQIAAVDYTNIKIEPLKKNI